MPTGVTSLTLLRLMSPGLELLAPMRQSPAFPPVYLEFGSSGSRSLMFWMHFYFVSYFLSVLFGCFGRKMWMVPAPSLFNEMASRQSNNQNRTRRLADDFFSGAAQNDVS